MRLSALLKAASIVALTLALALIAFLKSIDIQGYKGFLAARFRSVTGRDLVIDGPLRLEVGLSPKVVADTVTLSNVPWGSRRDMIRIKRVEARLELLPLLSRQVVVESLSLVHPDLLVETDPHGRANWTMIPGKLTTPVPGSGTPTTRFAINAITVRDGRLNWRGGKLGDVSIDIPKMAIQPSGAGGKLGFQMTASYEGKPFTASGVLGPLETLLKGQPWPMTVQASMAGMQFMAEGTAQPPSAGSGLDMTIRAQGDELAQAAALAGFPVGAEGVSNSGRHTPVIGPFKLAAHLSAPRGRLSIDDLDLAAGTREEAVIAAKGVIGDVETLRSVDVGLSVASDDTAGLAALTGWPVPSVGPLEVAGRLTAIRKGWQFAGLKGKVAGSDFAGDITLDLSGRPTFHGDFTSTSLALADFVTAPAKPGERNGPRQRLFVGGSDGRVFPATPLPFAALTAADGDITVGAREARAGKVDMTNLATRVRLDHGKLSVAPITAHLAGGTVTASLLLDASSGKTAQLTARMDGSDIDLGQVLRGTGTNALSGGTTRIHLDLRGRGSTIRELMASLDGQALAQVGNGTIHNSAVDWPGADMLLQILASIDPTSKPDDTTDLECAVVKVAVHDGLATADRGIAIETNRIDVVGAGTIDLRAETLNLGINPVARSGGGLGFGGAIAGMTRIEGTLANPRIGFDGGAAARAATAMGLDESAKGLPPLGEVVYDKAANDHPCLTALGKAPAGKPGKVHASGGRGRRR